MSEPFDEPHDATPLAPSEREGLVPTWIITRADLNAAEAANIAAGVAWARRTTRGILTDQFVRAMHKRMFGDVWRWAGRYRLSERNLGIEAYRIPSEIRLALDDVKYWIEHETFEPAEIAVRLHHRLVFIHAFPNGNGRHSRLMADILATRFGIAPFTWGSANLAASGDTRARYMSALREADRHNIAPLLEFARS